MTQKKTLGDKLREDAARAAARSVVERQKREDELWAESRKVAAAWWEEEEKTIEKRIKAHAKKGRHALCLIDDQGGEFDRNQRAMVSKANDWARANGMHTHSEYSGPVGSDDYSRGHQALYICWEAHQPRGYGLYRGY